MLQTTVAAGSQVFLAFLAVVVAPVTEELLFRGILYPFIKQRGYPRLALWGTAVLFGALHLNLMTFIPLTFLGLVLAWLYDTTDNLLAPIFAHSLFNTANFSNPATDFNSSDFGRISTTAVNPRFVQLALKFIF